jgi:hypothetical protein
LVYIISDGIGNGKVMTGDRDLHRWVSFIVVF